MDLFLRACGAGGPLQLNLEWPGSSEGEDLSFDTPYVVIGHDPGSDLVLEHGEVSDRHTYLQLIGGQLLCVDLGGRGDTATGGRRQGVRWIEPRETILIGPYRIRLVGGDSDSPEALDDHDLPPLTLDLSHRGFEATECPLAGGVALVGSSANCQVRLLDPDVSDSHCSLLYTATGVWVVDLLGKGGIRVNGVPVRHAMLYQGDELQVGASTIRVRHEVEPAYSPHATGTSWRADPSHEAEIYDAGAPLAMSCKHDVLDPVEEEDTLSCWESPERADRPAQPGEDVEGALAAASANDRRSSCRYPVADVDAVLSWYEPIASPAVIVPAPKGEPKLSFAEETIYSRVMSRWPGGCNGTPASRAGVALARDPMPSVEASRKSCVSGARLLDISQTGVQVLSEAVPPADQRIWLRLARPHATDWVEVVMKGSSPEAQGAHRVRLAFLQSCPYDFFKVVVYRRPGS